MKRESGVRSWVVAVSFLGCGIDARVTSVSGEGELGAAGSGVAGSMQAPAREPIDPVGPTSAGGASGEAAGAPTPGVTPLDMAMGGTSGGAPSAPVEAGLPPCQGEGCPSLVPGNITAGVRFAGAPGARVLIGSVDSGETQTCISDCSIGARPGTLVVFVAISPPGGIVRWSDARCGGQWACALRLDTSTALVADFEVGYNIVFMTSTEYTVPALPRPGAEANQECANRASAAGLPGQRWVAWLAGDGPTPALDDDIDPIEQLQSSGGWVRLDGVVVARSRSALARGEILHNVGFDEAFGSAYNEQAWTATSASGELERRIDNGVANDCANWTSTDAETYALVSLGSGVAGAFAGSFVEACSGSAHLLCFGDDSDAEVPVVSPVPNRLAFLSTGAFAPSTGVASADALCQQEACAAGLTGSSDCALDPGAERTFLSYLHGASAPAWERFDLEGPPWVRPDGIGLFLHASELERDGAARTTTLGVTLSLDYPASFSVWIGDAAGTSTCAGWTSSTAQGRVGRFSDNTTALSTGFDTPCITSFPVYCFEE